MAGPAGCNGCKFFTVSGEMRIVRWVSVKAVCRYLRVEIRRAMEQLTENIREFVKYRDLRRLVAATAGKATKVIHVPSSGHKYLRIDSRWFANYINTELGEIHDRYKAKTEIDSTFSSLGTPKKTYL